MSLFKKKSRIPEPPKLEAYPEAEYGRKDIEVEDYSPSDLPEFPEMGELPELPGEKTREEQEEQLDEATEKIDYPNPRERKTKKFERLVSPEKHHIREIRENKGKEDKDIFIKLEKFKEILASIHVMDTRIKELEEVIRKLKDVKEKEDQLIGEWHQEIQELNEKVKIITEDLEEKI
jgi:hypothetical protein